MIELRPQHTVFPIKSQNDAPIRNVVFSGFILPHEVFLATLRKIEEFIRLLDELG